MKEFGPVRTYKMTDKMCSTCLNVYMHIYLSIFGNIPKINFKKYTELKFTTGYLFLR